MPAIIDPDGVEIVTMRELVDFEGQRIVEIGCGDGRLTFECGREGASVLAFDSDEDAIQKALLLDIHPLGDEFPVLAGERGIGFVDTRKFRGILEAMDKLVEQTVAEGLFVDVRELRRHVVERYDNAAEALEEADSWENLRLPAPVRRQLQLTRDTPVEFIDTVRYRLLKKRGRG